MSSMQQDKIDQIKKIIRERYNEVSVLCKCLSNVVV